MDKTQLISLGVILNNSVTDKIVTYRDIEDLIIMDDVDDDELVIFEVKFQGRDGVLITFIPEYGTPLTVPISPNLFKKLILATGTEYLIEDGNFIEVTDELLEDI